MSWGLDIPQANSAQRLCIVLIRLRTEVRPHVLAALAARLADKSAARDQKAGGWFWALVAAERERMAAGIIGASLGECARGCRLQDCDRCLGARFRTTPAVQFGAWTEPQPPPSRRQFGSV
jgi:hypothetical protein